DAAVDIIIQGQEAIIEFLDDNLEALDRLATILKQKLQDADLRQQQDASKIETMLLPKQANSLCANNYAKTIH
ncbi:MAG: hypothetical protein OER96_12375, partial [Gammaproteobacteria bacterium]|nr:hypothetical protein [Gammaproteobacteria bacterium]